MLLQLIIILTFGFISIVLLPTKYRHLYSPIALGVSSLVFILSLGIWINFDSATSRFQYVVAFGPCLGLDGISLYFILLTTFLFPLCILASWGNIHTKAFLSCFLSIEILLVLVFSVLDLIWFYIFFESVLIPIFLIIGIWGSRSRKIRASYFFFLYTLIGSLFLLASIVYIFSMLGTSQYESLLNYNFSLKEQKWLWLGFFISFAVKVPMLPFHIWLPEAHVEAPTPGSAILAGVLLKLGTYGFIRFSLPLFPEASLYYAPFVFTLSIIGVFYTSLTAIRQTDLKRIIAYTSVAHINLVVLGIFSFTSIGLHGCIIQSLSHGFVSAALFLLIGTLYDRYHTRLFLHYGGLIHVIPIFGIFFVIFTIANIALPGTSSFVGEFLLLIGVFESNPIATFFGAISIVLGGIYSLWLLNRILYGNLKIQYLNSFTDLNQKEVLVLSPLSFAILYVGVYPELILDVLHTPYLDFFNLILLLVGPDGPDGPDVKDSGLPKQPKVQAESCTFEQTVVVHMNLNNKKYSYVDFTATLKLYSVHINYCYRYIEFWEVDPNLADLDITSQKPPLRYAPDTLGEFYQKRYSNYHIFLRSLKNLKIPLNIFLAEYHRIAKTRGAPKKPNLKGSGVSPNSKKDNNS